MLIVDYKTLRPPPASEDEVPPIYLEQLATYRAALARIYPGRAVGCALLWTEGAAADADQPRHALRGTCLDAGFSAPLILPAS